jgi:hypothetical protein
MVTRAWHDAECKHVAFMLPGTYSDPCPSSSLPVRLAKQLEGRSDALERGDGGTPHKCALSTTKFQTALPTLLSLVMAIRLCLGGLSFEEYRGSFTKSKLLKGNHHMSDTTTFPELLRDLEGAVFGNADGIYQLRRLIEEQDARLSSLEAELADLSQDISDRSLS